MYFFSYSLVDEIGSRVLMRVYEVTEVYRNACAWKARASDLGIWKSEALRDALSVQPILGGFPPRGAPNESLTPTSSALQGVQIGNCFRYGRIIVPIRMPACARTYVPEPLDALPSD
jgi:hypothetical protein